MAIGGRTGGMFTEINVTPLIDVFVVLLVVLFLVVQRDRLFILKVDPQAPCGCGRHHHPEEVIKVEVSKAGEIKVNNKLIRVASMQTITEALRAEQDRLGKQDIPTEVWSDPDATHNRVVAVMDAANGSGIRRLKLGLKQVSL